MFELDRRLFEPDWGQSEPDWSRFDPDWGRSETDWGRSAADWQAGQVAQTLTGKKKKSAKSAGTLVKGIIPEFFGFVV